jgi:hypothetical protein
MNTPRLFRPMFTLGIIVTFGAVASYLLVPGMRSTPGGVVILIGLVLLGVAAIVRDLYQLGKEIKEMEAARKKEQGGNSE